MDVFCTRSGGGIGIDRALILLGLSKNGSTNRFDVCIGLAACNAGCVFEIKIDFQKFGRRGINEPQLSLSAMRERRSKTAPSKL